MNECSYVGIECDVVTDVIISVFAFLNVRRVFNKSVRLCISRSELYLVWLLFTHHTSQWCWQAPVFKASCVWSGMRY